MSSTASTMAVFVDVKGKKLTIFWESLTGKLIGWVTFCETISNVEWYSASIMFMIYCEVCVVLLMKVKNIMSPMILIPIFSFALVLTFFFSFLPLTSGKPNSSFITVPDYFLFSLVFFLFLLFFLSFFDAVSRMLSSLFFWT